VAHQAVALDLYAEEQRIVVAISASGDDAKAVAAGLALHPELLAGAAPEGDEAGVEGFLVADFIEEAEHQHLSGFSVLHDAWDEAVHLGEVDYGCVIWYVHYVSLSFE